MSLKKLLLFTFPVFVFLSCQPANSGNENPDNNSTDSREFYQIKTYTFSSDEQLETTENYLQNAYLPALKRLGYNHVGVFKSRITEEDTVRKLFVLTPFTSLNDFLALDEELQNDEAHTLAGRAYLEASHENTPYDRIESTLLKAFEDMPKMEATSVEGPKADRVYELRSYEGPTEEYYRRKVDMFNAGGEIALFSRLNFNAVFYGEVISGSKMPNLMYMTTFPDMTVRDSLWKEFFNSPEWTELKAIEKYKNTVSHADVYLLYPAEYSDY